MATVINSGLEYMAQFMRGNRMEIDIETKTINAFEINDRVTIRDRAFIVSKIQTEYGPVSRSTVTLTEAGAWIANHMQWDGGLTLVGAIRKALDEKQGTLSVQELAEHVACRLSARLTGHIDCARAETAKRDKTIALLNSEIERLRGELQKRGMDACKGCEPEVMRKMLERENAEMRADLIRTRQGLAQYGPLWSDPMLSGMSQRLNESSAKMAELEARLLEKNKRIGAQNEEIAHLQSAVGKKRNKTLRLGKKIASQNEEIHRLNDLLRRIRQRYEGSSDKSFERMADSHDDVIDAMAYALHPNCRCAEVPLARHVFATPKNLEAGDTMEIKWRLSTDVPVQVKGMRLFGGQIGGKAKSVIDEICNYVPYAIRVHEGVAGIVHVDERPYAVLCGQCGHVISDRDAHCRVCGALNRACSECVHRTKTSEREGVCGQVNCSDGSEWEEDCPL